MKAYAGGLSDELWQRLCRQLRADTAPQARVLELMAETGLRIGDVLRITRAQLQAGKRSGTYTLRVKGDKPIQQAHASAPAAWTSLTAIVDAETVAHVVAPGGDGSPLPGHAAYQSVRRHLQRVCLSVGIEERMFLHRIRKTVGEQLYRVTGDMIVVRDALNHERVATTERYINKSHSDKVVAAHNARRKGESR